MFVGDQNGVERFNALADGGQPLRGLAHAEASIHQDARPLRRHKRRISCTSARQHAKFNDRQSPLTPQNTPIALQTKPSGNVLGGPGVPRLPAQAVTALRKNPYSTKNTSAYVHFARPTQPTISRCRMSYSNWKNMNCASAAERLKKFEGSTSYMYRCSGGEVTIGVGHAIFEAMHAIQLRWIGAGAHSDCRRLRACRRGR